MPAVAGPRPVTVGPPWSQGGEAVRDSLQPAMLGLTSNVYAASSVSLGCISVAVWVFVRIMGLFLLFGMYVNHTLAL